MSFSFPARPVPGDENTPPPLLSPPSSHQHQDWQQSQSLQPFQLSKPFRSLHLLPWDTASSSLSPLSRLSLQPSAPQDPSLRLHQSHQQPALSWARTSLRSQSSLCQSCLQPRQYSHHPQLALDPRPEATLSWACRSRRSPQAPPSVQSNSSVHSQSKPPQHSATDLAIASAFDSLTLSRTPPSDPPAPSAPTIIPSRTTTTQTAFHSVSDCTVKATTKSTKSAILEPLPAARKSVVRFAPCTRSPTPGKLVRSLGTTGGKVKPETELDCAIENMDFLSISSVAKKEKTARGENSGSGSYYGGLVIQNLEPSRSKQTASRSGHTAGWSRASARAKGRGRGGGTSPASSRSAALTKSGPGLARVEKSTFTKTTSKVTHDGTKTVIKETVTKIVTKLVPDTAARGTDGGTRTGTRRGRISTLHS